MVTYKCKTKVQHQCQSSVLLLIHFPVSDMMHICVCSWWPCVSVRIYFCVVNECQCVVGVCIYIYLYHGFNKWTNQIA